jgi:hypothetical protein
LRFLIDTALPDPKPPRDYSTISSSVVSYCKGTFDVLHFCLGRDQLQCGMQATQRKTPHVARRDLQLRRLHLFYSQEVKSQAATSRWCLSPDTAQEISRALAAAQAGEEYRRPVHPHCSWPAYAEDEGLTDWQADLLYEGCSACGTPCDREEVVCLLLAAAGKP